MSFLADPLSPPYISFFLCDSHPNAFSRVYSIQSFLFWKLHIILFGKSHFLGSSQSLQIPSFPFSFFFHTVFQSNIPSLGIAQKKMQHECCFFSSSFNFLVKFYVFHAFPLPPISTTGISFDPPVCLSQRNPLELWVCFILILRFHVPSFSFPRSPLSGKPKCVRVSPQTSLGLVPFVCSMRWDSPFLYSSIFEHQLSKKPSFPKPLRPPLVPSSLCVFSFSSSNLLFPHCYCSIENAPSFHTFPPPFFYSRRT